MGQRVLSFVRSPFVRTAFAVIAVAFAVVAIVKERETVSAALSDLSLGLVIEAFVLGLGFFVGMMLSWRTILGDLGSPLALRSASSLFFMSQVAKYIPGGVWNFVAAAELGADQAIPRRRTLSATTLALAVSILSGVAVATPAAAFGWYSISLPPTVWLLLPLALVMLAPPVLNRVLDLAMRLIRRPPLEEPLTSRGVIGAFVWSVLGWTCAGVQVWVLATQMGFPQTPQSLVTITGAFAVSWIVGFLAFFVPAGIGVREVVLAALLQPTVSTGTLVALVTVTRVLQTLADLLLAATGWMLRRKTPAPADAH